MGRGLIGAEDAATRKLSGSRTSGGMIFWKTALSVPWRPPAGITSSVSANSSIRVVATAREISQVFGQRESDDVARWSSGGASTHESIATSMVYLLSRFFPNWSSMLLCDRHDALGHVHGFDLNRSKAIMIAFKSVEQDTSGKPIPAFSHPVQAARKTKRLLLRESLGGLSMRMRSSVSSSQRHNKECWCCFRIRTRRFRLTISRLDDTRVNRFEVPVPLETAAAFGAAVRGRA